MKYNFLIFSFLILIISSNSAISDNNYIINNDTVYIDDSKVYLSATPHTLSSSGWVYFNLTSKVYTGNIDACWGFNTSVSKPTKAEVYSPYWVNTTTNHKKTFYNPSFITYTGNDLDYGNSYNINYRYTITESIVNENGTTYITSNASFDSYTIDGTNYTIYWYTRHDNYYLWKDFSSSFNSVIHNYKGYNKWYYIKNIPITSNKKYTVRAWIDVPVSTQKQSGKYYFAIKPSGETISQAINNGHFYNLDPWWDVVWSNRKTITLIGNTSGAQTNYQLLLNVTYEGNMQNDYDDLRFCNETHKLDSWLESKVDGSYALVWVEFPTTPANEINQTYYMYYGNEGVASDWDIGATFVFGDDFNRANSENVGNGWTEDHDASWTIDTNRLKYAYAASSNTLLHKGCTCGDYVYTWRAMALQTNANFYPRVEFDAANKRGDIRFCSNGLLYYLDSGDWHIIGAYSSSTWYECRLTYHVATGLFDYEVVGLNSGNGKSPYVQGSGNRIVMQTGEQTGTVYVDYIYVRKYAANPPTYTYTSEEAVSYMPPNPISLMNTTGNFWINHTWAPGTGNVTDSYNVSINDVWHNTSPSYYNDTYTAHAWQNITVWAYNLSSTGTLSLESVNQDTQIPNNPITILNTSDWTGDAGEIVYVDYDATEDIDSDVITFSCNRTDLFIDFDTVTGKGNWTSTANIYYVNFGISDGYGSISNYTMTLRELSVTVTPLLDEVKLIMSEITTGLKGVNMSNYLVYAFILIGILLIILGIQIITNNIYRG